MFSILSPHVRRRSRSEFKQPASGLLRDEMRNCHQPPRARASSNLVQRVLTSITRAHLQHRVPCQSQQGEAACTLAAPDVATSRRGGEGRETEGGETMMRVAGEDASRSQTDGPVGIQTESSQVTIAACRQATLEALCPVGRVDRSPHEAYPQLRHSQRSRALPPSRARQVLLRRRPEEHHARATCTVTRARASHGHRIVRCRGAEGRAAWDVGALLASRRRIAFCEALTRFIEEILEGMRATTIYLTHAWRSGQWESPTLRSCFVSSYKTSTRLVIAGLVFPVPGVTVVLCFLYIAAVNVVISAIARLHYSAVSREFSMCGGADWIPIHILPPLENGQKHFFICATSFASPSHQYGSNASGFLNTSGFQCNV
ncbi:hypothetical protein JHW43_002703 [Diplocarpon mali]|nr:hypothetical protein JHW43_002703 [Diplocarpon mali]